MIYSPAEDSHLLAKFVKIYSKNKSVLDMGTGSAILARKALESGASSVMAADINPEAVTLAKSYGISAVKSNLFSRIKGKFDIIVFNPPYLPRDDREEMESQLATTGGKEGDEIIIAFLNQAKKHLNKKGIILLLLSSLTPRSRIKSALAKNNLAKKTIGKTKLFMETLEVWMIS